MVIVKKIERLEKKYAAAIRDFSRDEESLLNIYTTLEHRLRRWQRFISRAHKFFKRRDPKIAFLLEQYTQEVGKEHERVLGWISFYLDLRWPTDHQFFLKEYQNLRESVSTRALRICQALPQQIEREKSTPSEESRLSEIIYLKNKLDRLSPHSAEWRVSFHELTDLVYQGLVHVLVETRYSLKNKFQTSVYSQISSQRSPDKSSSREAQSIVDWLKGYRPHVSRELEDKVAHVLQHLTAAFNNLFIQQMLKKILLIVIASILIAGMGRGLYVSDVDDRLYKIISWEIKRWFGRDQNSLILKQKKDYFRQQINDMDKNFPMEDLKRNVALFINDKIYLKQNAYMFFSNEVLKGFFLHLGKPKSIDTGLKDEVLDAATLLNPQMRPILKEIIKSYDGWIIKESAFRQPILSLRRIFIARNIFPFMFVVLENDVPYLFLFSEHIKKIYEINEKTLKKLELDTAGPWPAFPWVGAYEVEGSQYPFADRQGYFDGEFAIVFRRFSDKVSWTAYHETGHVIDQWRYKKQGVHYPPNVEVNAMLFPILWTKDIKAYIEQVVLREVKKADPSDFYSQASKGIMNGFFINLSQHGPDIKIDLISDRFETDRIALIHDRLNQLDTKEIRKIAFEMYHDPATYLSTAHKGRYISYVENIHEVIYGTPHGITQRGFVLGGFGFGPRTGPRFIRDGLGDGGPWDIPSSWMDFLSSVLLLIVSPRESLRQATEAEAIVAAVFVFFFFNAVFWSLHRWGTPYRKCMFYGRQITVMVDEIYGRNAWSAGKSFGREINEKQLLKAIFKREGSLDQDLKAQLIAFKATAPLRARVLFDICLLLAPFNPRKALIVNKLHDLLFFLPFSGPFLGRATWIWTVQKNYHDYDRYNRRVVGLLSSVKDSTEVHGVMSDLKKILSVYQLSDSSAVSVFDRTLRDWDILEQGIFKALTENGGEYHLATDFLFDRFMHVHEESQEFERLDEYTPGDDIRRIDWKSTARSVSLNPMVRKYSYPYGVRAVFWLDLRQIQKVDEQKAWAKSFVNAVQTLIGEEHLLEEMIIIERGGTLLKRKVNWRMNKDPYRASQIICAGIKEMLAEESSSVMNIAVGGFKFYAPEENQRFLEIVKLTDFEGEVQATSWQRLMIKKMNIFVIGGKMEAIQDVEAVVGEGNRIFYM